MFGKVLFMWESMPFHVYLFRAYPDGAICKKPAIHDKYINERVQLFTHKTSVSPE